MVKLVASQELNINGLNLNQQLQDGNIFNGNDERLHGGLELRDKVIGGDLAGESYLSVRYYCRQNLNTNSQAVIHETVMMKDFTEQFGW